MAAAVLSFLPHLWGCSRYYTGPLSDHFDGRRFYNPSGPRKLPRFALMRWMLSRERERWVEFVEVRDNTPPPRTAGDSIRVTFVNHSTVLIQTSALNILTDPIYSEVTGPFSWLGAKRHHSPGVRFENLPPIHAVLISHCHYDHLDLPTLARLHERDEPLVIAPLGVDTIIRDYSSSIRVEALDWGGSRKLSGAVAAHFLPVQHWSARWLWDRDESLWGAYALETPAGSIYFAGDAGYGEGAAFSSAGRLFGPFRLALLPIGSYEPRWFMKYAHLNPEEAVLAHRALKAQQSIALHFNSFQLSDEAQGAPAKDLQEALDKYGMDRSRFLVLRPGEFIIHPSSEDACPDCPP